MAVETGNCWVSEKVSQQRCCAKTLLWMIPKNDCTGSAFGKDLSRPKPGLGTRCGKHSWLRWRGLGQWGLHFHVRSLQELGLAATLLFFRDGNETKFVLPLRFWMRIACPKGNGSGDCQRHSIAWSAVRLHPLGDIEWRVNPAWFGQTWSFQNP